MDFPHPVSPTMATTSPACTSKFKFEQAVNGVPSRWKVFVTPENAHDWLFGHHATSLFGRHDNSWLSTRLMMP